jgi:hypothetical protein
VPISGSFSRDFNSRRLSEYGEQKHMNVRRKQFPVCPNFANTNYKFQGETLSTAIVDLQENQSTNKAASAYVSFSRLKKLQDLHVLRKFPIKLIQRGIPISMKRKIANLERKESKTLETFLRKGHGLYITYLDNNNIDEPVNPNTDSEFEDD